ACPAASARAPSRLPALWAGDRADRLAGALIPSYPAIADLARRVAATAADQPRQPAHRPALAYPQGTRQAPSAGRGGGLRARRGASPGDGRVRPAQGPSLRPGDHGCRTNASAMGGAWQQPGGDPPLLRVAGRALP